MLSRARHPRRLDRPRVGLRLAADRPWRFWLAGEHAVSPYRAAVHVGARQVTPI